MRTLGKVEKKISILENQSIGEKKSRLYNGEENMVERIKKPIKTHIKW